MRPAFNAPFSARQAEGPRECQVITTPSLLLPGAQPRPQPRLGLNGLGLPFSCMKWANAAHSQGCRRRKLFINAFGLREPWLDE